jgi:hypothetical protein
MDENTEELRLLTEIRTFREGLPGMTADAIRAARAAGATWDQVAQAVGMTPVGCRKLLQRQDQA